MFAQISKTLKSTAILLSAGVLLFSLYFVYGGQQAGAATEEELRNKTQQLEQQINDNQATLESFEEKALTLENKLAALETEIDTADKQIKLTENKIRELQIELEKTEAELERQKTILAEALRTLYIEGDVSSLELLFATDSFSEYFDQQEYLERLKLTVQESTEQVKALKKQIEIEKQRQEELLAEQEQQRRILADKQNEQQTLLNQTLGQEAQYQAIVDDLREQLQNAQRELEAFLVAQNFQSLGYVTAGTTIGYIGSSGFSTGPHLHFAIWDNGGFVDPGGAGGSLAYGMNWPTPTIGPEGISQYYGCVAPYWWYLTKCDNGNSLHAGLDIAGWYGEPIVAAKDGDIVFRGWLGGYGNAVIIDHGGGVQTYYAHLLE